MNINTIPQVVSISGVDMPLIADSLNYKTNAGTLGHWFIKLNGPLLNNDTITIYTTDQTLVFTAKTTPANDYEIPVWSTGLQGDYLITIDKIIKNQLISKNYAFDVYPIMGVSEVKLKQNNIENTWIITNIEVTTVSTAATVNTPQVYVPKAYNTRYKMHTDVYAQADPTAAKDNSNHITNLSAAAADDNTAFIYLQDTFHKNTALQSTALSPAASQVIVLCPNAVQAYWTNTYQEYGTPVIPTIPVAKPTTGFLYAIRSAFKYPQISQLQFNQQYVDADKVKLLTNLPSGKIRVPKTMQNRVYFYNKIARTDLIIQGRILLNDGTYADWNFEFEIKGYLPNKIYMAKCGYNECLIDNFVPSGKHAICYSVNITDNSDTPITEEFWFVLETRDIKEKNFFYFANAFGGFDCVPMEGIITMGLDAETSSFKNNENSIKTIATNQLNTYKVNTGLKYQDELKALGNLLRSDEIYWVSQGKIAENNLLVPVSFTNPKIDVLLNSQENAQNITLEFTDQTVR